MATPNPLPLPRLPLLLLLLLLLLPSSSPQWGYGDDDDEGEAEIVESTAVSVGSAVGDDDLGIQFETCYGSDAFPEIGSTLRLADFYGKVVIVATFYTGCSPGRYVAPQLAELSAAVAANASLADSVVFLASIKGSSSCATWASQKFNLDFRPSTRDAGIPIAIADTDSALHYMLFDGNPQLAVLDKQMVLRQVEKTESNLGRGNLVDFINSPDRLAALISELVAEPDPTPSQPRESANATEDDTGGSESSDTTANSTDVGACAPLVGRANAVEVFANDAGYPADIAFHPEKPHELWIANKATDDVTILDVDSGTAVKRRDRAAYHYMDDIISLAFDDRGFFATCQESENTYDGLMAKNWFMGPTLFHSQESDLIDQLGDPCSADELQNSSKSCFFTHWDMLHESPLCMGIAHDPETITPFGNVYWLFDGLNGTLMRYDFQEPHGPGSLDHSRASVRRYSDIQLTRVPGIPGHIAVDPATRVLYIADTGGNRILRVDPDSGHFLRTAKSEFPIYSSTAETFEYTIWGCTDWDVLVDGVDTPSGLHIEGGVLYVGEWGTSEILAFDTRTGSRIGPALQTGASGLMGLAAGPVPAGRATAEPGRRALYFTDAPSNTVSYIEIIQPCDGGGGSAGGDGGGGGADDETVWPVRECVAVVDETEFVDHRGHAAGYMNITAFLDIDDYADAEAHHCGGGDITQGAAMAGMPTSGRINNDALLMEGYMCHVCLPTPCQNGGVCGHPHAWAFTCNCTGTGHYGDICQLAAVQPGPEQQPESEPEPDPEPDQQPEPEQEPDAEPEQEPDGCGAADIDRSGEVAVQDVLAVLDAFGMAAPGLIADTNDDGRVGTLDLLEVLSAFGSTC